MSGVDSEFVVASSEVLYEGVAADDHAGGCGRSSTRAWV